jgi:hypothetical protein
LPRSKGCIIILLIYSCLLFGNRVSYFCNNGIHISILVCISHQITRTIITSTFSISTVSNVFQCFNLICRNINLTSVWRINCHRGVSVNILPRVILLRTFRNLLPRASTIGIISNLEVFFPITKLLLFAPSFFDISLCYLWAVNTSSSSKIMISLICRAS